MSHHTLTRGPVGKLLFCRKMFVHKYQFWGWNFPILGNLFKGKKLSVCRNINLLPFPSCSTHDAVVRMRVCAAGDQQQCVSLKARLVGGTVTWMLTTKDQRWRLTAWRSSRSLNVLMPRPSVPPSSTERRFHITSNYLLFIPTLSDLGVICTLFESLRANLFFLSGK